MENKALALLIDTDYCSGCHACEVACKKEHDLAKGVYGIKLLQMGPFEIGTDEYEYRNVPVVGKLCDLCAERRGLGKVPLCVQSCPGKVMKAGTLEEMAVEAAAKRGNVLWVVEA